MIKDTIYIQGKIKIELFNENLTLKSSILVDNLVTTLGKNFIAARLQGNSSLITHIGIGTSATAATAGQTALLGEISRLALNAASVNTTNTITYTTQFDPGVGTGAINEAGLFSAITGGTMTNRTTFATQNKAAGDTMILTWVITVN